MILIAISSQYIQLAAKNYQSASWSLNQIESSHLLNPYQGREKLAIMIFPCKIFLPLLFWLISVIPIKNQHGLKLENWIIFQLRFRDFIYKFGEGCLCTVKRAITWKNIHDFYSLSLYEYLLVSNWKEKMSLGLLNHGRCR